jgi:hypothetical protein
MDQAKLDWRRYKGDRDTLGNLTPEEDYAEALKDSWVDNPKAIYHDKIVTVKKYMEIQFEEIGIKYVGTPIANEKAVYAYRKAKYGDENAKLSADDYEYLKEEFYNKMPELIDLYTFIEFYSFAINENKGIKWAKVIIFSGYLICWTYIIYKSYGTVTEFAILEGTINYIYKIVDKEEPFSGLFI